MHERSEAVVVAALITGVLGCIGVILAATIGLALPFVQQVAGHTPTPVVIVVTATSSQPSTPSIYNWPQKLDHVLR
jgi:hypothetical protein